MGLTVYECCRQLGLEFHSLQPDLPLFDGETGARIGEEQDRRMEVLRDALMDAARARVEELGEAAVAGALPPFPTILFPSLLHLFTESNLIESAKFTVKLVTTRLCDETLPPFLLSVFEMLCSHQLYVQKDAG